MILVTLGTQDKGFERLLKMIDKEIKKGNIKEKVIVQAGYTKYKSKNMEIFDFLPMEELEVLLQKCKLLITHGGVGSILSGVKAGKKVIAISRLAKYKEHTNDHQIQIVKRFKEDGYILSCEDKEDFLEVLKKVKKFEPKEFKSNTENITSFLEECIEEVEKRSMINKVRDILKKHKEVINYLIFGVLTTIISLVVYYGLVYTVLNPNDALQLQIANIISWIASVIFAYITNRLYVFESNNKDKLKEVTSFVGSRVITLVLDMLIMFIGVTIIKGNDKLMKIISQVIVIVMNYILSKLFVFKKNDKLI